MWLQPEEHDVDALRACLTPGASEDFVACPLKEDVGSATFDDTGALEAVGDPVTWEDLKDRDDDSSGPSTQQTTL